MSYIFVNLKRFDIPRGMGGVSFTDDLVTYGGQVMSRLGEGLREITPTPVCAVFFPEAHILSAVAALSSIGPGAKLAVGCQSVYRQDVSPGGNFGAFTGNRTANSMKALGCGWTIIGHCEERRDKGELLASAGCADPGPAVNAALNAQIRCATAAGLRVLYCIGETAEERDRWEETLRAQLEQGLEGVDTAAVCVAYEPVWSIGPGKTPPDRETIRKVARFVKERTGGLPLVYGGGLKTDNAAMLASIPELDGGLIALTRFTGEIGFYPDQCLEIIREYVKG